MSITHRLQHLSAIKLWLLAIFTSVTMTEAIISGMGLLLSGSLSYNYLLTGLVASLCVAGIVAAVLTLFLARLRLEATRHQTAIEALAKSEERARQAITASNAALWDFDLSTGRVHLSDAWSQFLCGEQKPTYTTFQALSELVPEEERQALKTAIFAALKGHDSSTYRVTHRVKKPDGEFIWVLSEGRVTDRDQNGWALRMSGINRDITAQMRAEEALWQQKLFMRQVIDTDPNLIFVKDAAGIYLMVNQAVANYYNLPIQEIIGKRVQELSPDHFSPAAFQETDLEVMDSGREAVSIISLPRPDGREHWYLTIKRPLLNPDGSLDVLGVAVDITEQKIGERKLAESYDELQRLSSHLDNLRESEREKIASELHEEMGSVLVALKMRIAWLASKLPAGKPRLSDETDYISALLSDAMSKMHQVVGQLRPNLQEGFELVTTVEDYINKFQLTTGIECKLVLSREELVMDANQSVALFRILQEAMNNVADHAQASQVRIAFSKHDESLSLVIEDNGIGFDTSVRKDRSFGLIGIKERALMMNGKATISSSPGMGTRVSATLLTRIL